MKLKSLSFLFLSISLGLIYATMSSTDSGIYQNGSGCGGNNCHSTMNNTSTACSLSGIPTNYITGQTYTLTFSCVNTSASLNHGGFNILCSGGTFTFGTGSKTNTAKTQITHNAVSSTNSWTFAWTAPTTAGAVTFTYAGNCVNNNGNADSGDLWNTGTLTTTGSFPTSLSTIRETSLSVYPNPANGSVRLNGLTDAGSVRVHTMFGQMVNATPTVQGNELTLDISHLPIGTYVITAELNGKMVQSRFEKQ